MGLLSGRSNGNQAKLRTVMPRARDDEAIIVEDFGDELLIYDDTLKRAHSLGATAARVWSACDGSTDIETVAARLDTTETEVRYALDELTALDLLYPDKSIEVIQSGKSERSGITRRQMTMRSVKAGAAVVTAPLVYSISVNPALAAITPTIHTCELFTTDDCGASKGCGAIFGCCCCCQGGGSCKTCGSIAACENQDPTSQPCAPLQGGQPIGDNCSDKKGTNPPNERGCCSVSGASSCGCGWGPGGGCCKLVNGQPPLTNNCSSNPVGALDSVNTNCVPCCVGRPIATTDPLGCCKSSVVDCCPSNPNIAADETAAGHPGCCAKSGFVPNSDTVADCCGPNPPACCAGAGTCDPRAK